MPFRFIDHNGRERTADGLASLLDLARQGILDEETLLFDEKEGRWRKAREIAYLAPEAIAHAPEQRLGTRESEDPSQVASAAPEHYADQIADRVPESSSETVQGTEDDPARQVVAPAEHGTLWRRWTDWLRDDGACFRVGRAILVLCGLMFFLLVAGSPNPDAPEKVAGVLGRLLIGSVVMFFVLKRGFGLGKGKAILVLSALLFCFFGYCVQLVIVSPANNGKTAKIMLSALTDVQQRAREFSGEVALLNIDSVFEMLDGKRACKRADLVVMREKIGLAERKTADFLAYFESRVSQAKTEMSSIDPSASASFMSGVNKAFPQARKLFSLQREYYLEVDGLLAFLLEQSGPYQVTADGVRFSKESDQALYKTRIDRINQLAASSNSIKAEYQAGQHQP